jgi:hypothetical protein
LQAPLGQGRSSRPPHTSSVVDVVEAVVEEDVDEDVAVEVVAVDVDVDEEDVEDVVAGAAGWAFAGCSCELATTYMDPRTTATRANRKDIIKSTAAILYHCPIEPPPPASFASPAMRI